MSTYIYACVKDMYVNQKKPYIKLYECSQHGPCVCMPDNIVCIRFAECLMPVVLTILVLLYTYVYIIALHSRHARPGLYSPHVSEGTEYSYDPFKMIKVRIDTAASGCPGPSYILCREGRKNTIIYIIVYDMHKWYICHKVTIC